MNVNRIYIKTPLGRMIACATEEGVCLLEFDNQKKLENQILSLQRVANTNFIDKTNIHLEQLKRELEEYFTKKRIQFSISLDLIGTEFQKQVWSELLRIPFGQTVTYLKQAISIGKPKSTRAVANANGMNKIAIIIPCHRVIGSNGKLTGYAGGLDRKKWLLEFESNDINLFGNIT